MNCKTENISYKNSISYEIFYENQMNNGYKIDEAVLKKIIRDNVKVADPSTNLKLFIFYKSPKTRHLVMRNNLSPVKLVNVSTKYLILIAMLVIHSALYQEGYHIICRMALLSYTIELNIRDA